MIQTRKKKMHTSVTLKQESPQMYNHYTTTPRLAMDNLTLKAATATDKLMLKSYSDKLA